MGKMMMNGIPYGSTFENATSIKYSNETSGLDSTNVQDAIDEVALGNNDISFISNDALDNTDNPLEWTDVDVLVSGEKHNSILQKVSTMFKNIRYLYKQQLEIKSKIDDVTECLIESDYLDVTLRKIGRTVFYQKYGVFKTDLTATTKYVIGVVPDAFVPYGIGYYDTIMFTNANTGEKNYMFVEITGTSGARQMRIQPMSDISASSTYIFRFDYMTYK